MKKRSKKSSSSRRAVTMEAIAECLTIEEMEAIEVFSRGCRRERFLGWIGPGVRLVLARVGSATRKVLVGPKTGIDAVLGWNTFYLRPSVGLKKVMALAEEERQERADRNAEKEAETQRQEAPPSAPVETDASGQDQEFVGPPEPAVDQMEETTGAPPETAGGVVEYVAADAPPDVAEMLNSEPAAAATTVQEEEQMAADRSAAACGHCGTPVLSCGSVNTG